MEEKKKWKLPWKRRDPLEGEDMPEPETDEALPKSYYIAKYLQDGLALCLGVFTIYTCITGLLTDVIQRSMFLGFLMPMVFLNAFTKKRREYGVIMKTTGAIFAAASMFVFFFTAANYTKMGTSYGTIPTLYLVVGTLGILLVLEAARRMLGPAISIIAGVFLLYALFGNYLPGALQNRGYTWSRIVRSIYISSAGVFSTPIGTAATIIVMFVIFGAFLEASHGSDLFMDIAFALTGRSTGGPAKAAVVSSALVGCVSGSASANVATTGVFTIPLMKKAGYPPYYAGAVEAVASTGSQIMPPIMGSAAFIVAETLGVSYRTVAAAAIIPALLYYISVFLSVHYESRKRGMHGMDPKDIPNAWISIKKYGLSLAPLVLLVVMIVMGYSAMYTAMYAIGAAIVIAELRKDTRISPVNIVKTLIKGCKGVMSIGSACAAAGCVIGVISLTGVGLKLSSFIIRLAGGHIIIALLLTMIALFILGMGLPTAPAYMLVAVLVAPALTDMGVPALAAHLFVFYGACLSSITPPVAMAAYTAAGIANDSPIKIGVQAVKLALVTYIMPIFFVYAPALIGQGTTAEIVLAMVSGVVGCLGLCMGTVGFFRAKVHPILRLAAFGGGLLCIFPGTVTDLLGYGLVIAVGVINTIAARRSAHTSQIA